LSKLLSFAQLEANIREPQFETMTSLRRRPFLLIFLAVSLMPFWPTQLLGEESTAEGVAQSRTVPVEDNAGSSSLSRFPLHFSLSTEGGYDDNVNTTSTRNGSLFTSGRLTLSCDVNTDRTQLRVFSGGGVTYFPDRTPGRPYDVNSSIALSLTQSVSLKLTIDASVYAAYQTEPDFSSDVGPDSRQGNFFYTADRLSATYQWYIRFSTVSSYNFRLVRYDNSSVGTFQDRMEDTFGEEFRFHLLPRTILVGEYRFEVIDYDRAPRDSTSHFALGGVNYSFTPQLNLVTRGGATFRSYKNDGNRIEPYFEGSLDYQVARASSLTWTARYGVEEPNLAEALTRTTFRTGLQLKYGLSARVSSTLAAYYHHDENKSLNLFGTVGPVSAPFSEDAFDVTVGTRYEINPHWAVYVGFDHSEIISGASARSYSRNRYSAGLSLSF
jgi:hypothetical protein